MGIKLEQSEINDIRMKLERVIKSQGIQKKK